MGIDPREGRERASFGVGGPGDGVRRSEGATAGTDAVLSSCMDVPKAASGVERRGSRDCRGSR